VRRVGERGESGGKNKNIGSLQQFLVERNRVSVLSRYPTSKITPDSRIEKKK
jgi:hypothetical protein